jgi:DNA-directed RNA polymerase subunit RPC12/RpoP
MTVFEAGTILLVVTLAAAATAAIYVGLLNWLGGFYVVRCAACHHLTSSSVDQAPTSCPHCRHPVLLHPVYSARHHHNPTRVRVVSDRLRY